MRRLLLLAAWLLTACEAPVLEPATPPTRCEFRFESTPTRFDVLELGTQVSGAFVPFVDGQAVEIAPWSVEDSVGRWYFRDVFVRLLPLRDVGATVCASVQGDLGRGIANDQGVLLSRAGDGGYVGGPVPLSAEIAYNDLARFPELLDASVSWKGELLEGNGSEVVGGSLEGLSLRRVNHEGFLGVPPEPAPPDAGPPGGGVLDLGLSFITARPGEDVRVLISVAGERLGETVTLTADPLPPGVTLTLPAPLGPTVNDATARLSVAASVGPMSIPLRLTAQGALTRGVRDSSINVVPAVEREVALTVFGPDTLLPVGATATAEVHLAPLGGFAGPVRLIAEAPVELDLTVPTMPLVLSAPMNVTVSVRAKTATPGFAKFYAVAGRDAWGGGLGSDLNVTTTDAVASHVVLLPGFSESRVLTPGQPLQWPVQTYALPGGETTSLAVTGAPAGCAVSVPASGVTRVLTMTCDAGLPASAATLSAVASAGAVTERASWRLLIPGPSTGLDSFGVAPEPRPQALDQEWPQVAGTTGDRFVLGTEASGFGASVVGFDGGYGAVAPVLGEGVRVVTVGQGVSSRALQVTRLAGQLFSLGAPAGGPTNARGPFDAVGQPDGTLWAATGTPGRVWLGHLAGTTWTEDGAALPDLPGLTDLAFSVQNQQVVLATAAPQVVLRQLESGAWTTLPSFPASLVAVPRTIRATERRVLDVAHDNVGRPVVALITPSDALEVYRLEGGAWVKLGGVAVTAGLLPLSLSMAANGLSADPDANLTLAWHEATEAFALNTGARVLPGRAAQSRLRLMRLSTSGFVELAALGLDATGGVAEHPHVSFSGDGRLFVSFVEEGRVFVFRGPP